MLESGKLYSVDKVFDRMFETTNYKLLNRNSNKFVRMWVIVFDPGGWEEMLMADPGGDVDIDDVSDFDYSAGGQDQKQKIAGRMLSWHMNYGRGDNVGPPKYDSVEIPRTHVHRFIHSQVLTGELSGASLDMSSGAGGGKRVLPIPYLSHSPNPSREFSGVFGNVAWKERVDGWKMKQEKSGSLMTNGTSHAPSVGMGINDIDANIEYNMDDALLNDEARQPLSRKVSIPSSIINPYRMVIIVLMVQMSLEKSCGYEDKTDWGNEIGWI